MPINLHIVRTRDFLQVDAQGEFDFEKSRRVLLDLAAACIARGVHHALLDVRGMEGQLSVTELHQLAKAFTESGFKPTDALAVLHRYSGKNAQIFASFAEDRRMCVRAFDNYEEAMEWFSVAVPLQ